MAKLTQEQVLKQFKEVHGDRYDYSKFIYYGGNIKGIIICKKHKEFKQTPAIHKRGSGCPKCVIYKDSQEKVINDFKKVHGDKYDYSLSEYIDNKTKVKIICSIHGIFEQSPNNHKNGAGCPGCANVYSQDEIIKMFRKVHGNKYNYSLSKYINSRTNIKIICPIHGIFEQNPRSHSRGQGCKKCANDKLSLDVKTFFRKSKDMHGDKYDYSLSKYTGYHNNIKIICKTCKHIFEQKAGNHISGNGCPNCANSARFLRQEKVIEDFKKVHYDNYDYSLLKYERKDKKVKIICKKCGNIFEQAPNNHKQGQGCSFCFSGGFKINLPGLLYYLRIEFKGIVGYKIGITNKSVRERFGKDMQYITVLQEWYYEDGEECYQEEQRILKEFDYAKWKGSDLLKNGNTELFDRDVLLLDN